MSVMKIAGNNNGTATGVAVTADGAVQTSRIWRNGYVKIYEGTPASTSATNIGDPLDLTGAGAVSLRIYNGTDTAIGFGFRDDINTSSSQILKDPDGNLIKFTVPANTNDITVTPDDVPILQWIRYLRLYITPSAVPTSGTLTVYAAVKG